MWVSGSGVMTKCSNGWIQVKCNDLPKITQLVKSGARIRDSFLTVNRNFAKSEQFKSLEFLCNQNVKLLASTSSQSEKTPNSP